MEERSTRDRVGVLPQNTIYREENGVFSVRVMGCTLKLLQLNIDIIGCDLNGVLEKMVHCTKRVQYAFANTLMYERMSSNFYYSDEMFIYNNTSLTISESTQFLGFVERLKVGLNEPIDYFGGFEYMPVVKDTKAPSVPEVPTQEVEPSADDVVKHEMLNVLYSLQVSFRCSVYSKEKYYEDIFQRGILSGEVFDQLAAVRKGSMNNRLLVIDVPVVSRGLDSLVKKRVGESKIVLVKCTKPYDSPYVRCEYRTNRFYYYIYNSVFDSTKMPEPYYADSDPVWTSSVKTDVVYAVPDKKAQSFVRLHYGWGTTLLVSSRTPSLVTYFKSRGYRKTHVCLFNKVIYEGHSSYFSLKTGRVYSFDVKWLRGDVRVIEGTFLRVGMETSHAMLVTNKVGNKRFIFPTKSTTAFIYDRKRVRKRTKRGKKVKVSQSSIRKNVRIYVYDRRIMSDQSAYKAFQDKHFGNIRRYLLKF